MIIGVSGINDTDNPGPGVGVARSLKEAGEHKIVGLSYSIQDPGHFMPFVVDKSYILPYPCDGWAGIKQSLISVKENYGLDVVIPCLDAELPLYIKHQDELDSLGIKTLLPSQEQFELRNKECLAELSQKLDITYPETISTFTIDDLYKAVQKIKFPCVVKGRYYKAAVVYNISDAIKSFTEISTEWGFPILIQKLVKGDELNVIGAGDGQGGILGLVAAKKMTTTSLGKFWNGISIQHPALLETARKFVEISKWTGPFELECMVDGDNIFMIEINPRFPAWVYFATGIGVNLPGMLVKLLNQEEFEREPAYDAGKLMIRYTYEEISDIEKLRALATRGESE